MAVGGSGGVCVGGMLGAAMAPVAEGDRRHSGEVVVGEDGLDL